MIESDGLRLVAGGFQPVEAYDVLIANLDPRLHREAAPDSPVPLLERFGEGLTTHEVAALLAEGNDAPDKVTAERALIELVAAGEAVPGPIRATTRCGSPRRPRRRWASLRGRRCGRCPWKSRPWSSVPSARPRPAGVSRVWP